MIDRLPPHWRRRLRRAAAYQRPVAAALAALAVAATIAAVRPVHRTEAVLVASTDLASGTTLSAADVAVAQWPAATVPAGAVTAAGALVGHVLTGAVHRGELLTADRVLSGGTVPAGWLAVPVRIADAGAAALLQPGMRVDVLAAPAGGGAAVGAAAGAATLVASGVRVLATSADTSTEGGLIVLATDGATAARLVWAATTERLSVALLPS